MRVKLGHVALVHFGPKADTKPDAQRQSQTERLGQVAVVAYTKAEGAQLSIPISKSAYKCVQPYKFY